MKKALNMLNRRDGERIIDPACGSGGFLIHTILHVQQNYGWGQSDEVLDHGSAGILVAPGDSRELSDAIVSLLRSPESQEVLGGRLRERVRSLYSRHRAVERITGIYRYVLEGAVVPAG